VKAEQVRLETARLIIREFAEGDREAVHEYAADPEVVKYTDWGPNKAADTDTYLARRVEEHQRVPREQFTLAVTRKDGGAVIGGCRIGVGSYESRRADIGYVLNRKYWGKGYGTEAALALVRFGFGELKMHRIWATCHPDNRASQRVLEKCGMRYEGRLRDDKKVRGKWRDSLVFAVLEQDWLKLVAGGDFLRPVEPE
jgi:RimJ/RimL family protein N-acetyltransferase